MNVYTGINEIEGLRAKLIATKVIYDLPPFAWYDNEFIAKFEAAKQFLQIFRSERLPDFIGAFEVLRTRADFRVAELRGLLSAERFKHLLDDVRSIPKSAMQTSEYESATFGRDTLEDYPSLMQLQIELIDMVSAIAGEALEPCYNFLSFYHGTGMCPPHMDSPSAKWTLDLCLDQNCEWPIWFSRIIPWPTREIGQNWQEDELKSDALLQFTSYDLQPNCALLFSGSSQWHYRDAIPAGGFSHLAFLHYRPVGTKELTEPKMWHSHFGVPELAILNAAFDEMRPLV